MCYTSCYPSTYFYLACVEYHRRVAHGVLCSCPVIRQCMIKSGVWAAADSIAISAKPGSPAGLQGVWDYFCGNHKVEMTGKNCTSGQLKLSHHDAVSLWLEFAQNSVEGVPFFFEWIICTIDLTSIVMMVRCVLIVLWSLHFAIGPNSNCKSPNFLPANC